MLDKLLKMDSALLTIKTQIAKYKALFAADGTIDASEQATLDEMEANVKLIEPKSGKVIEKAKAVSTEKPVTIEKTDALAVEEVAVTEKAAGGVEELGVGVETIESSAVGEKGAMLEPDKSDNLTDPFIEFKEALDKYKKACSDGSLTAEQARELKSKMEAAVGKMMQHHNKLAAEYIKSKSEDLKNRLGKSASSIENYKKDLSSLSTDCIIGLQEEDDNLHEVSSDDIIKTSELDHAFEHVIEDGVQMRTGPSPDIAEHYEAALDRFISLYENASDAEKKKWKKAKTLVDKYKKDLESKLHTAADVVDEWEDKMRKNGLKGYFLYAEGTVNGELICRLDWKMSTTAAMSGNVSGNVDLGQGATPFRGAQYNNSEILIKTYTLTADAEGNLIYTPSGDASQLTNSMKKLASMLTRPEVKNENAYDMKPGGQTSFSGNTAGPDRSCSVMVRTPVPAKAQSIDIPVWTDGAVVTMIQTYENDCAAGTLTQQQAKIRKAAMQAEIVKEQQALILQLQNIHDSQNQPEDTAILLSIWRQKMKAWQDAVNSLSEQCIKEKLVELIVSGFDDAAKKFETLCDQGMLPNSMRKQLLDTMQDDINQQNEKLKELEKDLQNALPFAGDPVGDKNIANLKAEINKAKLRVDEQQSRLDNFKGSTGCFSEINVNAKFRGSSNYLTNETEITSQLQRIANIMQQFPELTITIFGDYAGPDGGSDVFEHPDRYAIEEYDAADASSEDGTNLTSGDVAMLRALTLKKLLVQMGANGSNINAQVGDFNSKMRARIIVQ